VQGATNPDPSHPHRGNGYDHARDTKAASRFADSAADATARARLFVMEHPLAAIGIAVAAGFVVGRLIRR
jgi:ElaB/YqjD/DUF883 family membrane-anchored ribosome-binding protein